MDTSLSAALARGVARPPACCAAPAEMDQAFRRELLGALRARSGAGACRYHWHRANAWLLIVLAGTRDLARSAGKRGTRRGDMVLFPRGPRGAQQDDQHARRRVASVYDWGVERVGFDRHVALSRVCSHCRGES
jgi:hypothetical protein